MPYSSSLIGNLFINTQTYLYTNRIYCSKHDVLPLCAPCRNRARPLIFFRRKRFDFVHRLPDQITDADKTASKKSVLPLSPQAMFFPCVSVKPLKALCFYEQPHVPWNVARSLATRPPKVLAYLHAFTTFKISCFSPTVQFPKSPWLSPAVRFPKNPWLSLAVRFPKSPCLSPAVRFPKSPWLSPAVRFLKALAYLLPYGFRKALAYLLHAFCVRRDLFYDSSVLRCQWCKRFFYISNPNKLRRFSATMHEPLSADPRKRSQMLHTAVATQKSICRNSCATQQPVRKD